MCPAQVIALITLLVVLAVACVVVTLVLRAPFREPLVKAALIAGVFASVAAVWGSVLPIVIIGGKDDGSTAVTELPATPTPTPPMNRATMKTYLSGASPEPTAEMK